jgi:peptidoglycan hydrolase CwlO-like protein
MLKKFIFIIALSALITGPLCFNAFSEYVPGTPSETVTEGTENISDIEFRDLESYSYDEMNDFKDAVRNRLNDIQRLDRKASLVTSQFSSKREIVESKLENLDQVSESDWPAVRNEIASYVRSLEMQGAQPR